jgi:pilus assembly protein CpaF
VMSISEITGMEGDVVTIQEVFAFKKSGIGENGNVLGEFLPSGIRPRCTEQLMTAGIQVPTSMFRPEMKF